MHPVLHSAKVLWLFNWCVFENSPFPLTHLLLVQQDNLCKQDVRLLNTSGNTYRWNRWNVPVLPRPMSPDEGPANKFCCWPGQQELARTSCMDVGAIRDGISHPRRALHPIAARLFGFSMLTELHGGAPVRPDLLDIEPGTCLTADALGFRI
jgi:hypothetical protein